MNKQDLLQAICKTGIPEYSASFWLNVPEFLSKAEDKMNSGEEITLEYVADLMNEVYSAYFLRSFKENNPAFDFPKAKEYLRKTSKRVCMDLTMFSDKSATPSSNHYKKTYLNLKKNNLDFLYPLLKRAGVNHNAVTEIGAIPEYVAVLKADKGYKTPEEIYSILESAWSKMTELNVFMGSADRVINAISRAFSENYSRIV